MTLILSSFKFPLSPKLQSVFSIKKQIEECKAQLKASDNMNKETQDIIKPFYQEKIRSLSDQLSQLNNMPEKL